MATSESSPRSTDTPSSMSANAAADAVSEEEALLEVDLDDPPPSTASQLNSLAAWQAYTRWRQGVDDAPSTTDFDDIPAHVFDDFSLAECARRERERLGEAADAPLTREQRTRLAFSRVRAHVARRAPASKTNTSDDFVFLKILGDGAFSTVFLARNMHANTGADAHNVFAVKVMDRQEILRSKKLPYIVREKDIMATLEHGFGGHPLIAKLFLTLQSPRDISIVMEHAYYGDLHGWLRRLGSFELPVTQFFAAETVLALEFLHECGVVHRDLKPENILVKKDGHIMICDFGSAKILGFDGDDPALVKRDIAKKADGNREVPLRGSFVGTAFYMSPEVVSCRAAGPAADYWALGCIVFQMIAGYSPFRAQNSFQVTRKISRLEYKFPEGFEPAARDLVERLLEPEAAKRLGYSSPEPVKQHAFFTGIHFDALLRDKPPQLRPYLPASKGQPAFTSEIDYETYWVGDVEPGLGSKTLARLMGLTAKEQFPDVPEASSAPPQPSGQEAANKYRLELLEKQRVSNPYHRFVSDHLIVHHGILEKRRGLSGKRRMFLLTEGPKLFYVCPDTLQLKGEVPITPRLRTEGMDFNTFFIHTPRRTYYCLDPDGHADVWCKMIEAVRDKYCDANTPELNFFPRGRIFVDSQKRQVEELKGKEREERRRRREEKRRKNAERGSLLHRMWRSIFPNNNH